VLQRWRNLILLTLPDLTLIQYEALLKSDNCSDDTQRRAMMVAKSMYFSARMEAVGSTEDQTVRNLYKYFQAWKEGNQTVADFMLRKITGINFISRTCDGLSRPPALR